MKTLQTIVDLIGIQDFNDLVMTFLSGDEDYISDSLIEGQEITPSPHCYMEKLYNAGYRESTFPWEDFRSYATQASSYLNHNLIIPLL